MYALSLTSGRFQASSGAQPKLVWDVLPPRARCARSLREDIASRQHFAPHASEMDSLATAASSIVSDGMPLTYLATTVSAGLLLLLGVASTVSQGSEARENTEETSTKAPTATGKPLALKGFVRAARAYISSRSNQQTGFAPPNQIPNAVRKPRATPCGTDKGFVCTSLQRYISTVMT